MSTVSLSAESVAASAGATRRLVARNTIYLSLSQTLAMPLAVLGNAVAAHYLGAEAFGYAYFATTLCTFAFLAVGWGNDAVLPADIARDRTQAGTMLGSSIAFRASASIVVYLALAAACRLFGYPAELQWALGLTALLTALNGIVASCKDTIRGFERTDIPAYAHFGQQLLAVALVIAVLLSGGLLRAVLLAHSVAALLVLAAVWRTLQPIGVGELSVRWSTIKQLLRAGTPFVVFAIAMELQPNIDAVFLSKLAPADVMGWYAVSRRLVGSLLLPATTLIGALYPTLCRLHASDREGFRRTANDALLSVGLVAVPMGLGCALFPEIGVALFSRAAFRPAEDNLRIMSIFVVLVYLSMPLGTCILSAGRQRAWSVVQCLCVVMSLVLDPLLVPFFQAHTGNGGLGLCVASVVSETIMIAFGIALVPAGVIDKKLLKYAGLAIVAGAAMAVVGLVARPVGPWVAAPLAMAAYVGALRATGAIDNQQIAAVGRAVTRRLPRFASQSSSS